MLLSIEVDYRFYSDIENYCNRNNISMQDYLFNIIEERHSINKFGDLNEIIPKVIEESTVEVKKRGRPKKKNEEVATEEKIDEPKIVKSTVIKQVEIVDSKKDDIKEDVQKDIVVKPTVKRKRTLKTL